MDRTHPAKTWPYVLYRESNSDNTSHHFLVARKDETAQHGFVFYNPDLPDFWTQYKVEARQYTEESGTAQIALLQRHPV